MMGDWNRVEDEVDEDDHMEKKLRTGMFKLNSDGSITTEMSK